MNDEQAPSRGSAATLDPAALADPSAPPTQPQTRGQVDGGAAPASSLSEEEAVALVAEHLAARGLGDLGWGKEASSLRERMRVLHEVLGDPWPDVSDEALAGNAHEWLLPWAKRL